MSFSAPLMEWGEGSLLGTRLENWGLLVILSSGNSMERGSWGTERAGFKYRLRHLPSYGSLFLRILEPWFFSLYKGIDGMSLGASGS